LSDASRQDLEDALARAKQGPSSAPQAGGNAGAVSVEQTRHLIEATIVRARAANNQAVADRATALQKRLSQLPPAASQARALQGLDDAYSTLLRGLRSVDDPSVRSEVGQLEYFARVAGQQAAAGIDPIAFDRHRNQTLNLLDAITAFAGGGQTVDPRVEALRARARALQRAVLATPYGTPLEISRARAQFFSQRQIERARVDDELEAAGIRKTRAVSIPVENRTYSQRLLNQLRGRLLAVGSSGPLPGAIDAAAAREAIAALIGKEAQDAEENKSGKNKCTYCHELSAARDQLAPLRGAGSSLLVNATFTHEHHAPDAGDERNCVTCHSRIRESAASRDVNLPSIATCRTCHAPQGNAANSTGCESCHKYHAAPMTALMWRP
jgi:hypothetical protein